MLTFDPIEHKYFYNGERVPNVTTILSPLSEYASVPRKVLEQAAARGNYVHEMCEQHVWGLLDESSIDEGYRGYLDAFKGFLRETGFEAEYVEQRVFHTQLRYAGTLDLGGTFPPMGRRRNPHRALIDIKTTFKLMASVGPQTAAYNEAWKSQQPKELHFDERYGLQLKADGSYKLLPYKSPFDMNTFRACLVINNFMTKEKAA